MIPRTAHFICLGREFGWADALSIRAALGRGGFERVILHHGNELDGTIGLASVSELSGFEAQRIESKLSAEVPESRALNQILAEVDCSSARTDVLRMALLWQHGGVFLSLDTIAVRSFSEVCRRNEFFCGETASAAPSKDSTRAVLRSSLLGRVSRALERAPTPATTKASEVWPKRASTGVLGAPAQDSFVAEVLRRISRVRVEHRRRPGALGADALETVLASAGTGTVLYPSSTFDPCSGPRARWWSRDPAPCRLDELKSLDTLSFRWHVDDVPTPVLAAWRQGPPAAKMDATLFAELASTTESTRIA